MRQPTLCRHCHQPIARDAFGWGDEDATNLDYCYDQDDPPPGAWTGKHEPGLLGRVNPDDSTASIDLEACNPEDLPDELARHNVTGREIAPATGHGFPVWRYTGTLTALADFLAENYDDGEGAWPMLARLIEA